ncbi:MAG: hypothetical protein ACPGK1_17485, partial [bacterium]
PDARSIEALNVAERYANGEATKEELKAAEAAARDAAKDAAWAAAWETQVQQLIKILEGGQDA